MADAPAFLLAHFTIDEDRDRYHQYEKGFFPILKAHGGRFHTFDDDVEVLEGERAPGRTVLIEFESDEALRRWWDSPEYQELAKHRIEGTTTHSIVHLHGMPPR